MRLVKRILSFLRFAENSFPQHLMKIAGRWPLVRVIPLALSAVEGGETRQALKPQTSHTCGRIMRTNSSKMRESHQPACTSSCMMRSASFCGSAFL